MSEEEKAAQAAMEQALGTIEAVNSMADAMTSMKTALEHRGWSTPMSERVGAQFGAALFAMVGGSK